MEVMGLPLLVLQELLLLRNVLLELYTVRGLIS
jgi:hypothetical protein